MGEVPPPSFIDSCSFTPYGLTPVFPFSEFQWEGRSIDLSVIRLPAKATQLDLCEGVHTQIRTKTAIPALVLFLEKGKDKNGTEQD